MRGNSDIIFARRLRTFRRQARLTQQELADQMTAAGHKMWRSAICNIETGHRLVTIGEAVQFAAALGIPLLALLADDLPHDLIEAPSGTPIDAAAAQRPRTRPALQTCHWPELQMGPRSGTPRGGLARRVDKAVAPVSTS
jgi:transcriptional regulator with XRE-family HTH domain